MGVDQGEVSRWRAPDGLRVTVVRMVGAHPVMAAALGAADVRDEPYALLVTRGGAAVGQGYYPSVDALGGLVDLGGLKPV